MATGSMVTDRADGIPVGNTLREGAGAADAPSSLASRDHDQGPAAPAEPPRSVGASFDLETAWIYKVSVLAHLVARRVGAVVAETAGLNLSQWRVLAAVADKPGRTASEVVDITPMDKVIVSRAVRVLVEMGYLRREASQADGRRAHLRLTNTGAETYKRLVEALSASGAAGTKALSGEALERFNAELDGLVARYGGA